MKKKFIVAILTISLIIISISCFGACDMVKKKLDTPKCVLLDDCLYWEKVENAVGYVVSVDGVDMPMQKSSEYYFDKLKDCSAKVRAVADKGDKKNRDSDFSSTVFRSKDPDTFTVIGYEELTSERDKDNNYIYTLSDEGVHIDIDRDPSSFVTVTVEPSVKLIRLTTHGVTIPLRFNIENRSEQMIFEFKGAKISPRRLDAIVIDGSVSSAGNCADVVIRSLKSEDKDEYGNRYENRIEGGYDFYAGKDGESVTDFGQVGGRGKPGLTGYAGIKAPIVCISGDKELVVWGGGGTPGGKGGNSSTNNGGSGGDGGDGGIAVDCDFVYVNIISGEELSVYGGYGGEGGKRGSGFLGGSLNSARDGERGARGQGISGTPVVISGKITENE